MGRVRLPHRARIRRRGSLYVAVMGVAMIIALVAMASLHLSRNEVVVLSGVQQSMHAEQLARSAVEFAIGRIKADANWRTTFTSGAEVPPSSWTSLGSGSIKFVLVDDDGNLNNDSRDGVTIRGIGKSGDAIQVATARMLPTVTPQNCLNVALQVRGDLNHSGNNITCSQMVSSNSDINGGGGSNLFGDGWAVGDINGSCSGTKYKFQTPARTMPDSNAWDYYLANGTRIDIDNIPGSKVEYTVLSASRNPYGEENPQGIYIIDCEGGSVTFSNCRICATVVVINQGSSVFLDNAICWDPPALNYPSLMTEGGAWMGNNGGSALNESLGVNFNPPSAPYGGFSDSDQNDSYPGMMTGLVYVGGNLVLWNGSVMKGVLIVEGSASFFSWTNFTYDSVHALNPPPGFAQGNVMRLVPRSFKRVSQ